MTVAGGSSVALAVGLGNTLLIFSTMIPIRVKLTAKLSREQWEFSSRSWQQVSMYEEYRVGYNSPGLGPMTVLVVLTISQEE